MALQIQKEKKKKKNVVLVVIKKLKLKSHIGDSGYRHLLNLNMHILCILDSLSQCFEICQERKYKNNKMKTFFLSIWMLSHCVSYIYIHEFLLSVLFMCLD